MQRQQRCSDYRKAVILICQNLKESSSTNTQIIELYRTAVKFCQILYAPHSKHTPKLVLGLHNLVYQHRKTCNYLFIHSYNPVFSSYFHSITLHSPLLLQIISLHSVHTEMQEHLFGQAKQITKGTSSLKPNHVISNFSI